MRRTGWSWLAGLVGLVALGCAATASAQAVPAEKTSPTNDEINLMLAQTGRAIQEYKPLIDQDELLRGQTLGAAESIGRARQIVDTIETVVASLKAGPQRFNGPEGLMLLVWLDNADRAALDCGAGAALASAQDMGAAAAAPKSAAATGNRDKAEAALHIANSCRQVSTLINIVRENVVSLYARYVALYDSYVEASETNDQSDELAGGALQQSGAASGQDRFRTQQAAFFLHLLPPTK